MKFIKNFTFVLAIFLAVLSTFVFAAYLYVFHFSGGIYLPKTYTATYFDELTDSRTGEKKQFIEVNIYNANEPITVSNPTPQDNLLVEFRFNSYTDWENGIITSYGIQLWQGKYYKYMSGGNEIWVPGNSAAHEPEMLTFNTPLFFPVGDDIFAVKLAGTYQEWVPPSASSVLNNMFNPFRIIGNAFRGNMFSGFEGHYEPKPYTMEDFLNYSYNHFSKTSAGYGKFNLPLLNLAGFFKLEKYNKQTGQFDAITGKADYDFAYMNVHVKNIKRGAYMASDSLFNSIAYNSSYNTKDYSEFEDYHHVKHIYTISNAVLDYRYDFEKEAYMVSLNSDLLETLLKHPELEIYIALDLQYIDYYGTSFQIVGFDSHAFFGLKIKEVRLYNAPNINYNPLYDFYLSDYSLWDTDVTKIDGSPRTSDLPVHCDFIGDNFTNSTKLEVAA